eukprot:scaffold348_cov329-Pavlova_lutheri.AAC.30
MTGSRLGGLPLHSISGLGKAADSLSRPVYDKFIRPRARTRSRRYLLEASRRCGWCGRTLISKVAGSESGGLLPWYEAVPGDCGQGLVGTLFLAPWCYKGVGDCLDKNTTVRNKKNFREPFDASSSDENIQSTKRRHENNGSPSFKQGGPHVNTGSCDQ